MLPKDFYRFWFQHQKHYQSMLYYIKVFIFPLLNVCSGARGFPGSSAHKEYACNARDPNSVPGLGRSPGEGIGFPAFLGFPGDSDGKESACNVGDPSSIPGLGRSPGGGHDNPLQYSWPGESPWTEEPGGLQSMQVTNSQT